MDEVMFYDKLERAGVAEAIPIIQPVLDYPGFWEWPASARRTREDVPKHHGGRGGLALHTLEVLELALHMADKRFSTDVRPNRYLLAIGAVWHDIGKVDAYEMVDEDFFTYAQPATHHITHGIAIWNRSLSSIGSALGVFSHDANLINVVDKVTRIISSHHGLKEWGSPDGPATIEEVIVHHADVQSLIYSGAKSPYTR